MYGEREGSIPDSEIRFIEDLTSREKEVLYLTARGLSTKEIAGKLYISNRTVDGHLVNIRGKLYADSASQAVFSAIKERILSLEQITQDLDPDQIKSIDSLTPKELEVLNLFTTKGGMDNEQIADEMRITTRTVRNYFSSISGKLSTKDESENTKVRVGGRILAGVIYLSYLTGKG